VNASPNRDYDSLSGCDYGDWSASDCVVASVSDYGECLGCVSGFASGCGGAMGAI